MNEELIRKVEQWAEEKGIFAKSAPGKQVLKAEEEVAELVEAVFDKKLSEIELEMGDVLVTIIILAKMHKITLDKALEAAYTKISKRKGKMVNGLFVKE